MINPDKLTEEQINNIKNSLSDFSKKINEFVNQIVIDIPKIQIPSFSNFSDRFYRLCGNFYRKEMHICINPAFTS